MQPVPGPWSTARRGGQAGYHIETNFDFSLLFKNLKMGFVTWKSLLFIVYIKVQRLLAKGV